MKIYKKIIKSSTVEEENGRMRSLNEIKNVQSYHFRRYSWIPLIFLPLAFVLFQGFMFLFYEIIKNSVSNNCENLTLNSYGENCEENSDCDNKQGLYCPTILNLCNCPIESNSIFCDCKVGYYWNYEIKKCELFNPMNNNHSSSSTSNIAEITTVTSMSTTTTTTSTDTTESTTSSSSTLTIMTSITSLSTTIKTQCDLSEYYDLKDNQCHAKINQNEKCDQDFQCFSPMICDEVCKCKNQNDYHDATDQKCTLKSSFGEACKNDLNCHDDKNLECKNRSCSCNSLNPQWSLSLDKCINPSGYDEICDSAKECDIGKFLKCNSGKCGCWREYNNEYFWDGSLCIPAIEYNKPCIDLSSSFMCKTLTEGTKCFGSNTFTCTCDSVQYYSLTNKKCEDKKVAGIECLEKSECRDDLGLECESKCKCRSKQYFNLLNQKCEDKMAVGSECQDAEECVSELGVACFNGVCSCDKRIQHWDGISCINSFSYNDGPCNNDTECAGNLICQKSGTSCRCSLTVALNLCDCPSNSPGSENYWDGSDCVPAKKYNESCIDSFMCSVLTENTRCITFACLCRGSLFFNFSNRKCESKLSDFNSFCQQEDQCRGDIGLKCDNGLCKCNSETESWNGRICQ